MQHSPPAWTTSADVLRGVLHESWIIQRPSPHKVKVDAFLHRTGEERRDVSILFDDAVGSSREYLSAGRGRKVAKYGYVVLRRADVDRVLEILAEWLRDQGADVPVLWWDGVGHDHHGNFRDTNEPPLERKGLWKEIATYLAHQARELVR